MFIAFTIKRKVCSYIKVVLTLGCLLSAFQVHAFSNGDDDTILIEAPTLKKASYSVAFKAFSKNVLNFDFDEFFSGGKNCKDAIIRNFSQLADRTHYKFKLKQNKVEVRFTLNF